MAGNGTPRRVALTGASSGIGSEAARMFAERGDCVALIARSGERLQQLAGEIGNGAVAITADLGRQEEAEAAIERAVSELGGLDVLVANAAATAYGPFMRIPPADFRRTVDVSLFGVVDCVRAALPHLEESEGAIVVTGSIVRELSVPLFSPYNAAKGALRSFCDTLRAELKEDGSPVSLSIVEPGPVDTPFWTMVKSSTGRLPPVPFGASDAEDVARKIVERAEDPSARSVVGPLALVQRTVARAAPSLLDRILPITRKYLRGESRPASSEGALWQPSERASQQAKRVESETQPR